MPANSGDDSFLSDAPNFYEQIALTNVIVEISRMIIF